MQVRAHSSHLVDIPVLIFWQQASLIPLEVYAIQFDVLRQAKGEPAVQFWQKPRRFVYNTFESQLPCIFPSVNVDGEELVGNTPGEELLRPRLLCNLCLGNHIKSFAGIVGFWAHIVHRHQNVDDTFRLAEVQRTAALWHAYWANWSWGGKRGNPTMAKLEQAQRDGFSWNNVLEWDLR